MSCIQLLQLIGRKIGVVPPVSPQDISQAEIEKALRELDDEIENLVNTASNLKGKSAGLRQSIRSARKQFADFEHAAHEVNLGNNRSDI